MTDDQIITLSVGIGGAFIGGIFVFFGTLLTFKLEKKKNKENEEQLVKNYLLAIHDEVESVWTAYEATLGLYLQQLEVDKPCDMYWPVSQDYFTVYHSNATLLGKVVNESLRKSIITSYLIAKTLKDCVIMNNYLLEKNEKFEYIAGNSANEHDRNMANACLQALIDYAPELRSRHYELKQQKENLFKELRAEGIFRLNA